MEKIENIHCLKNQAHEYYNNIMSSVDITKVLLCKTYDLERQEVDIFWNDLTAKEKGHLRKAVATIQDIFHN